MKFVGRVLALAMVAGFVAWLALPQPEPAVALDQVDQEEPAPSIDKPEDFVHQVAPILKERCGECHTGEENEGGLSLNSRASMMRGGRDGPAIEPGNAEDSLLYFMITDPIDEYRMPPEQEMMPAEEIAIIRAWIEAGAPWEEGFTLGREFERAPLKPRQVELPEVDGVDHPIDRLLADYLAEHDVQTDEVVDDRTFARRVHLDLVGLLPTPQRLDEFVEDTRPDKRERLVDELLADDRAYADHWMAFWNDALRNAYRGTGFIDDGRRQITGWLYESLYHNKPYDEFVHELISPVEGSEGFTRGIIWRGVVNASQRREMQAAQSTSQVFLGTNLKCSSCHDSFTGEWELNEAYALATVFADEPLEVARCDTPLDYSVEPAFLFPELGQIDPAASRDERVEQLADLVTHPENGRLTRTIVNRLWGELLGRPIVWPADEMDNDPFHRDLLDYLAEDFRRNGYDIRRTLKLIATSRAYQLPVDREAVPEGQDYVFRGPLVQRMSAEQFVDAVSMVTGVWQDVTSQMVEVDGRGQGGQLTAMSRAWHQVEQQEGHGSDMPGQWVWTSADANNGAPGGGVYFRRTFELEDVPYAVHAAMSADNQFELYVNGDKVAEGDNWQQPAAVDLTPYLREGENTLAVLAVNWPDRERELGVDQGEPNPAGWIFAAVGYDEAGNRTWALGSDADWKLSQQTHEQWRQADFDDSDWEAATVAAASWEAPWHVYNALVDALHSMSRPHDFDQVRAVMAMSDPLMSAMGQPGREQVVTNRDSIATTLQALELTNGYTLDRTLRRGAEQWLERDFEDAADLVTQLYRAALGRRPGEAELEAAVALIGSPPERAGVQDLLWAVVMLPEFQLIY